MLKQEMIEEINEGMFEEISEEELLVIDGGACDYYGNGRPWGSFIP